ncbi:hypothetical protein CDD80_3378 [Ophiocordyceps camponoti-rufipedis]|uniref:DUF155 domain-containing protein n=1 Tax=Ophiocordyceps camponoti-rufipedis TaxID=2004952 RepID=A0A2C5ZIX0_9HYPO|nr:hypothetical protein CDD80_3378 [Ophiocordyceps camponoti-rufipedis]
MSVAPQRTALINVSRTITSASAARPPYPNGRHVQPRAWLATTRRRLKFTSNGRGSGASRHHPSPPSPSPSHSQKQHHQDEPSNDEAGGAKRKAQRVKPRKNSLLRLAIDAHEAKKHGSGDKVATEQPSATPHEDVSEEPSMTISATCVAEAFDMPLVVEILTSHGFALDPDRTGFVSGEVVHARSANGSDIFVFPSGTVVTWSLPVDAVTGQLMRAAEHPHKPDLCEAEDLEFTVDPSKADSTMKGDLVILGTQREHTEGTPLDTTLAKVAFSSGLARSTKLAVLESTLDSYLESTRNIPSLFSRGSAVSLGRRFILQKTGELLSLRARLNHYWELTDVLPDILWENEGLDNYYETVGRALDVRTRIKVLNQKMDYAQEIATVLREVASERHGTRLELIIILLIAVEVVFEVRRIYLESVEGHEPSPEADTR